MKINVSERRNFIVRWANMLDRCDNPENASYKNYGGRGIKVYVGWYDFLVFIDDLPNDYFKKADLDRIDNDGNYEPGNIKWSTRSENCKNRRTNRFIKFNGEKKCISDWARLLNLNVTSLMERLDNWSLEDALTLPKGTRLHNRWDDHIKTPKRLAQLAKPKKQLRLYSYENKQYTMMELSKLSGIPSKLLRKRINERKWSIERALTT